MSGQKCGTWSEPSAKVQQFWCGRCDKACPTFKTKWYKGHHAGGDEDRDAFCCPDCGDTLGTAEVT